MTTAHVPHAGLDRPTPAVLTAHRLAAALAGAGVLAQMAFPFTDGGTLPLTVVTVVALAGAALAHAAATGASTALALAAVAGGGGLLAEAVGVRTGLPFGGYDYTGTLGPEVVGVPLLVPLAWIMMAWPALVVARRLVRGRLATALVGSAALTAWDVFLDPQMVDAGHWRWDDPHPALPGVEGIPLTNFAGWLVVSLAMVALLDRLTSRSAYDALPLAVYLWTYASSVLAHALFFGRPPVALTGGLLMGLVAVPLVIRLGSRWVRDTRRRSP